MRSKPIGLVTGGLGYIGAHTVTVLAPEFSKLIIVDNLSQPSSTTIDELRALASPECELSHINADIRDKEKLNLIFKADPAAVVFHFAALKSVAESMLAAQDYYSTNVVGTHCLLDAMKENSVHNLIFSSSAAVYGDAHLTPMSEALSGLQPSSVYGMSKLVGEFMIKHASEHDFELNAVLLRYFNPAGCHESGKIRQPVDEDGLFSNLSKLVAGLLSEFTIHGCDYPTRDGTAVRDFLHVMDVARGHLAAWMRLSSMPIRTECFNLGSEKGYTVREVCNEFQAQLNHPFPIKLGPRRPGDVPVCVADCSEARRKLSWASEVPLHEICASVIAGIKG